jgi:O-antigen ligase/cytochrome c-type biogenesis protein CcmH/NrfG
MSRYARYVSRRDIASGSRERSSPAWVQELRVSRLRQVGVALICAKVILVPLVFDPSLDMPFVVSKALVSHGLSYVLAAIMVSLLLRFGPAFITRSWLHVPVFGFLLASVLSTVFASNTTIALFGTHARMLGLGSIADSIVLYLAIVLLIRTTADARRLVVCALVATVPVLAYELVQMLGLDPFGWSNADVNRPFSTLGQATALGQYLMTLSVGALALALLAVGTDRRLRGVLLFTGVSLLVGAVCTGTRSALLGLGVGSVLLIITVLRSYPSRRARTLSVLTVAASAAALALILAYTPLGARITATFVPPTDADDDLVSRLEPSAITRLALYDIGLDIVQERPLLGYGPDNFTVALPRYRPERAPIEIRQSLPSSAHSWVVQVATSSGLLGLACFVGIALVAFGLALRSTRPAAAAGATMLATFLGTGLTTVNEFGTEWLFWASVGVIASSTSWRITAAIAEPSKGRTKRRPLMRQSPATQVAGIGLVTVSLLAALFGVNALDASRSARGSEQARLGGQGVRAVELGAHATRSDPGRAEYWHKLGLAYVALGRWSEAIGAFDRASALAPHDARYTADLATAHLLSGDSSARLRARELGDQATRIDPNNPRAYLTRAVVMHALGNLSEAVRSIERALALDPDSRNEQLYISATKVFLDGDRPADAIKAARQGLVLLGGRRASIGIRMDLARALVVTGRPREAVTELDVLLLIQPNEPAAIQLRAQIIASISQ